MSADRGKRGKRAEEQGNGIRVTRGCPFEIVLIAQRDRTMVTLVRCLVCGIAVGDPSEHAATHADMASAFVPIDALLAADGVTNFFSSDAPGSPDAVSFCVRCGLPTAPASFEDHAIWHRRLRDRERKS